MALNPLGGMEGGAIQSFAVCYHLATLSKVRALFLGREPEYYNHHHEDADYHDYYDYEF